MAVKHVEIEGIGTVTLFKRRGLKSMRLSVTSEGTIRLSVPHYVPYQTALAFALSKRDWLLEHKVTKDHTLQNAQQIGKQHTLRFIVNFHIQAPQTRVTDTDILVSYPSSLDVNSETVQAAAAKACIRALRSEAEATLPDRLIHLAARYGFSYRSITVKKLKGRWGSCDQEQNIVLNLYLMQLPWELIDYVILHELVHTKHLNHGDDFWNEFLRHEPEAKALRKRIRTYQPNFVLPYA